MTLKKSSTLRYLSHIFDIGAAHNDFSILKVGVCVHGYIKPITLKVERIADIILLTFLILAGIGLSAFGLSILRGFLSCESSAIGASWNSFWLLNIAGCFWGQLETPLNRFWLLRITVGFRGQLEFLMKYEDSFRLLRTAWGSWEQWEHLEDNEDNKRLMRTAGV